MLIIPNDKIPDAGKIGINIRTVVGIELEMLKFVKADGRARVPEIEMKDWESTKGRDGEYSQ
jgi:hypothetical protein